MKAQPIPINQYNCQKNQWWAGRTAVLLTNIEDDSSIVLEKGSSVTIVRKVASGKQIGHTHEINFEIRSPRRQGHLEIPCTSLSLIDDSTRQ